jgi:hypothetical protein
MRSFSKTMMVTVSALGLAIVSAGSVSARTRQDAPATVVRVGDAEMTCRQMADEGAALSADMGASGPGLLGRVGGIARAGATLLVPGAGLAVAGAEALTSPAKARREAEADTRRDRWNYLNGLYAGRGCDESSASQGLGPVAVETPRAPAVTAGSTTSPTPRISPAVFPQ